MSYTLLGASTLGFDLVRLERGDQVAALLLRAMALQAADLPRLAAAHPGPVRRHRWEQALQAADAEQRAGGDPGIDLRTLPATDAAAVLLERLRRTRLGTLPAVDTLVRREILAWTWESGETSTEREVATQGYVASLAADVLVDAVVAAYGSDFLDPGLAHDMGLPFTRADLTGPEAPCGDVPADLRRLLDGVARLDGPGRDRLRAGVDGSRHRAEEWAPAMHEATWAAHLTGRIRTAAAAQLLAVRAFRAAGLSAHDGAAGCWNAVSGAVQAHVVADLLNTEHHTLLTTALAAAIGSTPPGD